MSSKPLSNGEQSLLQKGPKFAVSSSKVPLMEYIAVTKQICDELGENTTGRGLYRNLPENQRSSTTLQGQEGANSQHHQKGKGGQSKTLREDSSHVVLTADKGVALVVMDKSQYIDKCMALLNDTKVYKTLQGHYQRKLHRDVQESLQRLNREHGSSRLYDWSKMYYNKLLPTGNSSPAPRFYGFAQNTQS